MTIKYVMDTNTLIGFSTWNPINLNKNFWDKLGVALEEGKWVLLDVVVKEVLFGQQLKDWCKKQKGKNLITDLTQGDRDKAIEINNKYPMIDQNTYKSTVDTYIIAHASNNNIAVFSRETYKTSNETLYKIPDVCKELKILHTKKPEDFLESIGFRN